MSTTAKKIVNALLDKGLAKSTFRDLYPAAYDELLSYRDDMEADVTTILKRVANVARKKK